MPEQSEIPGPRRRGGTRRTLVIVGVALLLAVGAGSITFLALRGHKSVDPGCLDAQSVVASFRDSVQNYESEIRTAEDSSDRTLIDEDIDELVNYLTSDGNLIQQAQSATVSASLRSAESTMAGGLARVVADYRAIEDTSQGAPGIGTDSGAVMNDAAKIDELCE